MLARLLRSDHGGIDVQSVLRALAQDHARDPARWQAVQQNWYAEQQALWSAMAQAHDGGDNATDIDDRRFRAAEWRMPYFNWLARSYITTAKCLMMLAEGAQQARQHLLRDVRKGLPINLGGMSHASVSSYCHCRKFYSRPPAITEANARARFRRPARWSLCRERST